MRKKRFYDAVRDLIRDVQDPPEQPARTRRRLSISSLLAAPQTCAACWEPIPNNGSLFACNSCLGAYCSTCLAQYARTALTDRHMLPLRCADQKCRAPVPLSGLHGLLTPEEVARLSRFQCEILRRPDETPQPATQEDESPREAGKDEVDNDEALKSLMGTMGWRRCPDCGTGIERTQGCPHMVCVCGGEFCYSCGERWIGGGVGCPRHCGLPQQHDALLALFPARFEELREEVWQRIAALLASLRDHLEHDRGRSHLRSMREAEPGLLETPRISALRSNTRTTANVNRTVTRGVTRNAARDDAQPVKMRLRSLVHPSRENRL